MLYDCLEKTSDLEIRRMLNVAGVGKKDLFTTKPFQNILPVTRYLRCSAGHLLLIALWIFRVFSRFVGFSVFFHRNVPRDNKTNKNQINI